MFSNQPVEFAKIALVIFTAAYLVSKRAVLNSAGRKVLGLVLPRARDLGPLLLALVICLGGAGRREEYRRGDADLLGAAGDAVSGDLPGVVADHRFDRLLRWRVCGVQMFPHVRVRVDIWLHPFADPQNTAYQLVQSLFGLGSGGIFGTGLGTGHPDIVPYASTDFISAAVGEELGTLGLAAVLLCYLLPGGRGLRAAVTVKDPFGALLAGGLSFSLVFQMFIVRGVTDVIPLTGLTTPWLSYGGSSLLANYIILALLIRISDAARRPPTPRKPLQIPLQRASTEMVPTLTT